MRLDVLDADNLTRVGWVDVGVPLLGQSLLLRGQLYP